MSDTISFTVTDDHLGLARQMYVSWEDIEFGAPSIDPKRPYGNSDVYGDIAAILGLERGADEYEPFTIAEQQHMDELHKQMQTVLQIALRVGRFEAGDYVADRYFANWRRAGVPAA